MKHKILMIVALLMGATLLTSCGKSNVDEESIVGNWQLQQNSTAPTLDVRILADGDAHFDFGPGCFGQAITLSYRWTLDSKKSEVHFEYMYNSNGTEEMRPDVEWKLKEVSSDKLVVEERYIGSDDNSSAETCTYIRK